ncbi:MAG: triphosphoribosyl-dephospho-CoA synthase [Salinirussus sp.]
MSPDGLYARGETPRTVSENAQLALLLEVAGTPKPGNVDRRREYPDLRFEHLLAGAVGARAGLAAAADGARVGAAFERAVAGMSRQSAGNTQFGAVLLLVPLVRATAQKRGALTPEAAEGVVEETTVEDAVDFYRAFDHVDVAVGDPPEESDLPDVRRGSGAETALRNRGLTLADVMAGSADRDGVAREHARGFERTFRAADRIADADGPVADRASSAYLAALASEPDTLVVTSHGPETAAEVQRRAALVRDGETDAEAVASELVDRGINPGTTADLVAGGLFVALERGLEV